MGMIPLVAFLLAVAAQEPPVRFDGNNVRIERDASLPGNPVVKVAFGCHSDASDADLARLKAFPELRELSILSDEITDAGLDALKSLPRLETLRLNSSTITDKGIECLVDLRRLKTLVLFRTQATPEGIALLKKLPALRALHLCRIAVTADMVARLKELTSLERLGFEQLRPEWREKAAELVALLPRTRVTLP